MHTLFSSAKEERSGSSSAETRDRKVVSLPRTNRQEVERLAKFLRKKRED